ncbi:sensor histidine kinase [Kaistia sp. MMO-174]
MHELATNAAKYGALSVPQGRVEVRWALRPDDPSHFELHWRESGGPAVTPPLHKGFGTRLIQQALAAELRGEVQVIYEADGVVCRVHAPVVSDWERGE